MLGVEEWLIKGPLYNVDEIEKSFLNAIGVYRTCHEETFNSSKDASLLWAELILISVQVKGYRWGSWFKFSISLWLLTSEKESQVVYQTRDLKYTVTTQV